MTYLSDVDVFEKAIKFAVMKHSHQERKRLHSPYILHPMEVAAIAGTMSSDPDLLAACVLHDTVEDTDTTIEEIKEEFGTRVALLVMTETEDKRPELPSIDTWQLRKEESLIILSSTKDIKVKMLWMGDKLSNMRSFARDYRKEGNDIWNAYNQKDPAKQYWYYKSIAENLVELKEYDAYQEYVRLMNYVFQDFVEGDKDEQ